MITYESITKIFGTSKNAVTALRDVSFTVEQGDVVVLLGPSGCGKTTTLRLTNRLESLTRGRIYINGEDSEEMNPVRLRQSMGYVIQEIGLFPNKTIAQNIAVVPKLLGWKRDDIEKRTRELFHMVNLDPDTFWNRYPAELSGGQQQRIGVARGLAADPEILLMDEPFGAIDPINREQIQNEFLRLQGKLKKTVVFVSHDIHEAIKVGDKIALFSDGRMVQYDRPEIILTQPKNEFVADFVGADRALKVLGLRRVRDATERDSKRAIQHETPSGEALDYLEDKRLKFAIVLENETPTGYVTPKRLKHESGTAGDAAAPLPACLEERQPLRDALSTMLMHDLIVMCVVDDNGSFVGTISYNNIQNAIADIYSEESEDDVARAARHSAA